VVILHSFGEDFWRVAFNLRKDLDDLFDVLLINYIALSSQSGNHQQFFVPSRTSPTCLLGVKAADFVYMS